MREILSNIEREEIFEDVDVIPVYSSTQYKELFSSIENLVTGVITGVWQWESGLTVQWQSGANVELE